MVSMPNARVSAMFDRLLTQVERFFCEFYHALVPAVKQIRGPHNDELKAFLFDYWRIPIKQSDSEMKKREKSAAIA